MKKILTLFAILIWLFSFSSATWANNGSTVTYKDLVVGEGKKAVPQKVATIQLIMWENQNGKKGSQLFTTYDKDASPIKFKIGTKKMSDGLNLGILGMRVGGKRILYVPSALNPKKASDEFPGNVDLIYEVELLGIK